LQAWLLAAPDWSASPSPAPQNGGAAQDGMNDEFVLANHYMDSFAFHPISGRAIIHKFGYPQCSKK
jgi:hypothetical protein